MKCSMSCMIPRCILWKTRRTHMHARTHAHQVLANLLIQNLLSNTYLVMMPSCIGSKQMKQRLLCVLCRLGWAGSLYEPASSETLAHQRAGLGCGSPHEANTARQPSGSSLWCVRKANTEQSRRGNKTYKSMSVKRDQPINKIKCEFRSADWMI